ncbi:MAG: ERCC4 domain-containing protein [Bacilli bacterium]
MIIEMDTRNQKDEYVTEYLDKQGIKWIRNKLYAADIKLLNSTSVLIDLKKDLLEMCGNLTSLKEHERIKKEIERAREIGCERFIFLIKEQKIKSIEEVPNWNSKRTKVKGETLMKIMKTMSERYNVEFIFTTKENAGAKVIELLKGGINYDISEINF